MCTGYSARQIATRVQVRHVEGVRCAAQEPSQAEWGKELPVIRKPVRHVRKDAPFDAFRAATRWPRAESMCRRVEARLVRRRRRWRRRSRRDRAARAREPACRATSECRRTPRRGRVRRDVENPEPRGIRILHWMMVTLLLPGHCRPHDPQAVSIRNGASDTRT